MTSEKLLRTFIAVDLSDELKQSLESTIQKLKASGADVKWVAAQNCHVTLKFLGDTTPRKLDDVKKSLQTLAQTFSPFSLRLNELGAFPSVDAPRIIWVGVKKGAEELT